jgi:hypothetical protein
MQIHSEHHFWHQPTGWRPAAHRVGVWNAKVHISGSLPDACNFLQEDHVSDDEYSAGPAGGSSMESRSRQLSHRV